VVRGVLVLAVGVLLAVWVGSLFRDETVVEPDPVDFRAVAAQAQPAADFTLAVPGDLPDGWRATSARWEPLDQQWHLGILTDDNQYVGVEQATANVSELVAQYASAAVEAGTVDVAGTPWRRFVDEESGEVALVLSAPRASTLVTGTVAEATLVLVAAGLPEQG